MRIERKNDAKKTWSMVNPKLDVVEEEVWLSNAVIGPSWKGTYLTFIGIKI